MTAPASSSRGGAGLRTAIVAVVIALVFVAIAALAADKTKAEAYDPTSNRPSGTKALVETLEHFGAEVTVPDSFPPPDADIAVVFDSVVPPDQDDAVRDWVALGHTLVIADPASDLSAEAGSGSSPHGGVDALVEQGVCTTQALRDVRAIDRGSVGGFITTFAVTPDASSCFGDQTDAVVVVRPEGAGRIVSVASAPSFVNENLNKSDNAALATALMAPAPGTKVAILTAQAFATVDDAQDADLRTAAFRVAGFAAVLVALQLAVAVVVYGFFRGRRLGHPVTEPQPVQIASSELVEAIGNLLQLMKQPDAVSALLRADARRELCLRLGLPMDADPQLIADTIAARTPIDRDEALRALADAPVGSDRDLVELANQIDTIREEVLHGHAP